MISSVNKKEEELTLLFIILLLITFKLTTKHLQVDPIQIKETFEFGRNSTESQKKASSNNSGFLVLDNLQAPPKTMR